MHPERFDDFEEVSQMETTILFMNKIHYEKLERYIKQHLIQDNTHAAWAGSSKEEPARRKPRTPFHFTWK